MPERICVGAIAGAFGVRGEVRLKSFTSQPDDIAAYSPLWTEDGKRMFTVRLTRPVTGGLGARLSGVDTREAERIELNSKLWKTIVAVNNNANREIEAITDQDHWGVVDRWDIPTDGKGDCEDYVLLKRKRLAEAGLPRRAMLVTVVIDEENAGHAVLMIRTDRGDFVLDNKRNAILPWSQTGYVYVKRESQYRTGWTSLGGAQTPTVASVQR